MVESPLHIRLLGGFELRRDGSPLPALESARAEALLAYLLLHRETPQSRQHLAFLLWPDSSEPQARTNLRHVLHRLRHSLADADRFLDVTPRTLGWRPEAPVWLDVAAFEMATRAAEAGDPLPALREAVELYRGDLLAGSYEEWIVDERERLRQRYLTVLSRLVSLLESRGEHDEAIHYAEHLLRHDPVDEEAHRLLMRLHDARGDRARALRVYHACAAVLERELGVEPSTATRAVYDALLPVEREPITAKRPNERIGGLPLVGRTPEWARLTALWRATEQGHTQFVLVSGEPGIGKSRLVEELRTWCDHLGAVTVEARSYAAEGTLPYRPVVTWLQAAPLRERLLRLDTVRLTELARLLPELLVDVPGLPPPEPLSEPEQRQRMFDAISRVILAPRQPLLLVADDLQWCDRETFNVLHYLLRREPEAPLLVAATARREEVDRHHPLSGFILGMQALDRYAEIPLERLTRGETAALAERIAGRPVTSTEADQLYDETEGSPLFVVEALRAGWQGRQSGPGWTSPKVQAAIEARLAQLSEPARGLVALAATVGRAFTTDVLAAASESDEEDLVQGLDELWRRRIIREQGTAAYDFSHDKIREAAYLGLSPPRRRNAHLRVARALEQIHEHDPGPVSGHLAVHFEEAGAVDEAVIWYIRAAAAAQRLHANLEVIRLLDRALSLIDTLPVTFERQQRTLAILTSLSTTLGWVEGWASPRLAAVQVQALALADSLGVEPTPPLLRSLAIVSLARRDFAAAHGYGAQIQARARHTADDMLQVEAGYVLGIAAFWEGKFTAAREHFETAVGRYRPELRGTHLLQFGLDPQVICLSRLANALWFLGLSQAAARTREAALALAGEVGHPYSTSTALLFAALLSLDLRDPVRLRQLWTTLAASLDGHDTRPTQVSGQAIAGFIDVLDGHEETGIARIMRTLDEAREADHAPGMRACLVRVLLEACAVAGAAETGLAAAEQMLASGDPARLWEAETHRLRAEYLAALGARQDDVEAALTRSMTVARRQNAMMLQLRTATSLLRYRMTRMDHPSISAARGALAAIVDALPEHSDSPDLQDATVLLERR